MVFTELYLIVSHFGCLGDLILGFSSRYLLCCLITLLVLGFGKASARRGWLSSGFENVKGRGTGGGHGICCCIVYI